MNTLLITLLLFASPAWAQHDAPFPISTFVAIDGSTARTPGVQAPNAANVRDYGAKGDARLGSVVATIAAGSRLLAVSMPQFSAADVGKTTILGNAGIPPANGPVLTASVSSAGAGYTNVPNCTFTDASGSGTGATCAALMSLQSAIVATGGGGCAADGTYEFIVGIDAIGTPAKVTGSVVSGALAGSLTVTAPGVLTGLGTLRATPAYGGNCTTAPAVNLSYGVAAIWVTAQGAAYSSTHTTVTLSGGFPASSAALGAVTIGAPVPPLVTTIISYTSPTQVTLAKPAAFTLSGSTVQMLVATDDQPAIQAAIVAAIGGQQGIWLPAGTYWLSSRLDPGNGDLTVRGDGPTASVLVWDAGQSVAQMSTTWTPAFGNTGISRANMRGSLQFEDLQFRGTLDFGRINTGAAALELNFYKEISFDRIRVYQAPNMAMALEGIDSYRVQNSTFDTVMRDQARCRSCFNAIVRGNRFLHSDDDSIALHQAGYIQGPGNIREGLIVEGNTFEDTTCIHILGARSAVVRGNVLRRCKVNGINISTDSVEGSHQQRAITVSDNIVTDLLARPPFSAAAGSAISVRVNSASAPANVTRFLPSSMIQGTAYFGKPWDYDLNNDTPGIAYASAARGVVIRGNQVMRTLPAAATYSSWGFGNVISDAGFVDPPIPDASQIPTSCYSASANIYGLNITANIAQDCRRGISLVDNTIVVSQTAITINFNQIFNTWEYGIVGFGTGNIALLDIIGNQVLVDPYGISPGRSGGHGGWSANYSASRCLSLSYTTYPQVRDNTFGECYAIGDSPSWRVSDNVVRGIHYSGTTGQLTSWSEANYGIGVFPIMAGNRYWVHNSTSDPTEGTPLTYGVQSSNRTPAFASAAPNAGTAIIGEIIWSSAPGACGCVGWQRLTTGAAWVANIDYKVIPLQ